MAKGAVTERTVYASAQTDTVLWTPANGKAAIVWNCILSTTGTGTVTVKFATSGDIIAELDNSDGGTASSGTANVGMVGAVDETITITCPAGTTVILFADDIS